MADERAERIGVVVLVVHGDTVGRGSDGRSPEAAEAKSHHAVKDRIGGGVRRDTSVTHNLGKSG